MEKSYLSKPSEKNADGKTSKSLPLTDNRPKTAVQQKLAGEIVQRKNTTGLPDNLKSGIENLSGHSMDDVKVHYNSSQPAQLNAHAYAQGNQIHIATGQEKHLPHEAWHVVQQKQGRVRPTKQLKGKTNINDDAGLEKEADVMGAKALQSSSNTNTPQLKSQMGQTVVQRLPKLNKQEDAIVFFEDHLLDDIEKNMGEIEKLEALATEKGWDDLLERITHYLGEHGKKQAGKKASAAVLENAAESEVANWKIFDSLDKEDISNLPKFLTILKRAQSNDWSDLEDRVLLVVHNLEDYRDFGRVKKFPTFSEPAMDKHKPMLQAPQVKHEEVSAKELEGNKGAGLEAVFRKMLATSGKHFEESAIKKYLAVAEAAHDLSGSAAQFTSNQHAYQNMLVQLGIPVGTIMSFNRSAGYEYEFSRFYEQGKIGELSDKEILRSHVLLAVGQPISSIFNLGFRLETDSHNSLEMVTPPFLFLVSGQTKTVLKQAHDIFQQAVKLLKGKLEISHDALISSFMGDFEGLGFGRGWAWREAKKLCATNYQLKQVGVYGQINVSLTPAEIIALMPQLLSIEKKKSQQQVGAQVYVPSKPMALFNQIFPLMLKPAGGKETDALAGAIGLYARSVSNILAIPSVLYRNILKERPDKGNYATDVKETLGIWVKDFTFQVIDDYIKTDPSIKELFMQCIHSTAGEVWSRVQAELETGNAELYQNYMEPHQKFYANKIPSLENIKKGMIAQAKSTLGIEQEKELPSSEMLKINQAIMARAKTWDTDKEQALKHHKAVIEKALNDFLREAEQEYRAMVMLLLDVLGGKEAKKPRPTDRDEAETFGEGHGVRKETYLGKLPGKRDLRVAELRNSDNLAELEDTINK